MVGEAPNSADDYLNMNGEPPSSPKVSDLFFIISFLQSRGFLILI